MKQNYARFIDRLIHKYEGDYDWDKHDHGGPTKYGITCYDLAEHRHQVMDSMARWAPLVQAMGLPEAEDIYASKYAAGIQFDMLPNGIDACMLDYAVNSGVSRPIHVACAILGIQDTRGRMTVGLLDAIKKASPRHFINAMCDERLHFMQNIHNGELWMRYRKGWTARVADLRAYALALVDGHVPVAPVEVSRPHGKAKVKKPDVTSHATATTAGAASGAASAHMQHYSITVFLLVVAAFIAGGVCVYLYQKRQADKAMAKVVLPPPPAPTLPVQPPTPPPATGAK